MPKENVTPFTTQELPKAQADYFEARYSLECQIAALRAQHLQPVAQDLKTVNKDFQARAGVQAKEIEPDYLKFKLWRESEDFEKESEREARRANMRRIFDALARGEQLDFIKADACVPPKAAPVQESPFVGDDSQLQTGGQNAGTAEKAASEPRPLNGGAITPRAEPEPEPDAAWGASEQSAGDGVEHSDAEGHAYQEGLRFGQAGNLDIKALIKQKGLTRGSADAISMAAGHAKGFAEWESANVGDAAIAAAQIAGQDKFQALGH